METDSGPGGALDANQGYEARVAEEKALLSSSIRVDETRPVYSAIRNAFIDRFARYYVWLTTTPMVEEVSPSKLGEMELSWKPLVSMLFERSSLWHVRDWRHPKIVNCFRRHLARPWNGRPATKVKFAIQAMELRLLDPDKWTWSKVVEKLCDCGKVHTDPCGDNLRRDIVQVEQTLRRLGIEFDPAETPHISPMG
jgi:hypothetical protein